MLMGNNKKEEKEIKKIELSSGGFLLSPEIQALAQATPITAGIAAYLSSEHSNEQMKIIENFLSQIVSKVEQLEESKIDEGFFSTEDGKRLIANIIRGITHDSRKEKLEAYTNLTINLSSDSPISLDDKDSFVNVLYTLNPLQLAVLEEVIGLVNENKPPHNGFSWEKLSKDFESKGVDKDLITQSLSVLESNGLINRSSATITEENKTHFVTGFGQKFDKFVSQIFT